MLYSFFGTPSSVFTTSSRSNSGTYILTNSEFKFDAEIKGFQFAAVSTGSITINVCLNIFSIYYLH